MHTKRLIIFIFIAFQAMTAQVWAANYYVDKTPGKTCSGNYSVTTRQCNGTNGTSYTTVQAAANMVKAGDSVIVRAGTYVEAVTMKSSGLAGSPITFKNYNSESAIVDAQKSVNYTINWGTSNNYIIWDGIEVTGGGRGGLYVRGNYNIIQNTKAHDNNNTVDAEILLNKGDYNIVRKNEVYNGQNGIMIQDCNYTTIEHNFVHDCPGHTGIDFLPIDTRNPQILWTGNNARYNVILRCNRGIYSRYQQNNEYVNNVVANNILTGINFAVHPTGYQPTVYKGNTKVYNNTIVGNATQGIDLVGTQNVTIKNNIITNNTKEGIRTDSSSTTGIAIDYNLYNGNAINIKGVASSQIGSHEKSGDPLFTNSAKGDFSIISNKSAAYDSGLNLLSEKVSTDIVGTSRPQNNLFDIGSYEYRTNVVTVTPTPTTTTTTTPTTTTTAPSQALLITAASGVLTAPMQIASTPDVPGVSYIATPTANSGTAVYKFSISQSGTYKIVAQTFSANSSSDSFYVKIDNGTNQLWDLNPKGDPALYNVWRQDAVTGRGTGTFDAPQFDPLTVQLSSGNHTITFTGRDSDTRLAYFNIIQDLGTSTTTATTTTAPTTTTTAPTTTTTAPTTTTTAPTTTTTTAPSQALLITAASGVLTAPMQIASTPDASGVSYIATPTNESGSAVYNFKITQTGTYKIVAETFSANSSSDSFYVKIDNGTNQLWDLNPTGDPALYNVWRQDAVAGRGTGTFDAPQFDPLTVKLSSGNHTITFTGRDSDTRLAYFNIIQLPEVTPVIEAESGTIKVPMKVVKSTQESGGAYVATTTTDKGTAVYKFSISQSGTYKIVAKTFSPNSSSDSFYVKIDNGTNQLWDLNPKGDPALYNVWRQDAVTGRGTGTFDAPQFDPLTVQLSNGYHTITFTGRDSDTSLDSFYLEQLLTDATITTLQITQK